MITDLIFLLMQKPSKKVVGNYPFHKVFVVEKEAFFCYDDLGSISNARRIQLDGFMQGQMQLNISRETFRVITKKMYEQAELSYSIVKAHQTRLADALVNQQVNSAALKPVIDDTTLEQAVIMMQNIKDISLELAKRTQMLTLPEMIYEVAAILFFTKKDDPRAMLPDQEISRRKELFKKKNMVSDMLRTPIKNFWQDFQKLDENSLIYMVMRIMEQDQIATLQEEAFLAGG